MMGRLAFQGNREPVSRVLGYPTVTVYAYCSIGCIYCSVESQGRSRPWVTLDELDTTIREQVRAYRSAELKLGYYSDLYPPEEQELGLSRRLLEVLTEEGVPFRIVTKGDLVLRDIDLLKASAAPVTISAGITDENAVRRIEPRAPSFARRVEVVHELLDAGVRANVSAMPWIPGLSDCERIIAAFASRTKVTFGALGYGEHTMDKRAQFGLKPEPPAKRAFGRDMTQQEIIRAYLAEAARWIGTRRVHWAYPPGFGESPRNWMSTCAVAELCAELGVTEIPEPATAQAERAIGA